MIAEGAFLDSCDRQIYYTISTPSSGARRRRADRPGLPGRHPHRRRPREGRRRRQPRLDGRRHRRGVGVPGARRHRGSWPRAARACDRFVRITTTRTSPARPGLDLDLRCAAPGLGLDQPPARRGPRRRRRQHARRIGGRRRAGRRRARLRRSARAAPAPSSWSRAASCSPRARSGARHKASSCSPTSRGTRSIAPAGGGAAVSLLNPSNNSNGIATDAAGMLVAAHHGSRNVTRGRTAIASSVRGQEAQLAQRRDRRRRRHDLLHRSPVRHPGRPARARLLRRLPRSLRRHADGRVPRRADDATERRGAVARRQHAVRGRHLPTARCTATLSRPAAARWGRGRSSRRPRATSTGSRSTSRATSSSAWSTGVEAFSPTGARWGVIAVRDAAGGPAFGDADHRTLAHHGADGGVRASAWRTPACRADSSLDGGNARPRWPEP